MEEIRIAPVNSNDADFLFCIMNNEVILTRLHEIPTTIEDWCNAIRIWEGDADEENYIIWSSDKPIGWFSFNNLQSVDRIAYLKMAVILPEYQNKGIGTYVLTYLVAHMKERRYHSVMLFTDKDNINAQKCYQKCGFDVCEELVETMSDNTNVERCKMVCKFQFAGRDNVIMYEKITLCGDNCIECPRYTAHSEAELKKVAELWYRVGWRNSIVSNEEISCSGCSSHKQCTYHLVECIKEHNVEKCNQCNEFPCQKISDMLIRSKEYQKKCREICTEQEYGCLTKAFFDKENNLRK